MKWNNIKNKLPEDNQFILIFTLGCKWIELARYTQEKFIIKELNNLNRSCTTHWMPLPSPPEVDE